jgi:hypothetical protein
MTMMALALAISQRIYIYLHKRGLPRRMNYCRKIFGTHAVLRY